MPSLNTCGNATTRLASFCPRKPQPSWAGLAPALRREACWHWETGVVKKCWRGTICPLPYWRRCIVCLWSHRIHCMAISNSNSRPGSTYVYTGQRLAQISAHGVRHGKSLGNNCRRLTWWMHPLVATMRNILLLSVSLAKTLPIKFEEATGESSRERGIMISRHDHQEEH